MTPTPLLPRHVSAGRAPSLPRRHDRPFTTTPRVASQHRQAKLTSRLEDVLWDPPALSEPSLEALDLRFERSMGAIPSAPRRRAAFSLAIVRSSVMGQTIRLDEERRNSPSLLERVYFAFCDIELYELGRAVSAREVSTAHSSSCRRHILEKETADISASIQAIRKRLPYEHFYTLVYKGGPVASQLQPRTKAMRSACCSSHATPTS